MKGRSLTALRLHSSMMWLCPSMPVPYQFCKLLKAQFPGTQFVITTHDRLWAEQMKSAGLVTNRGHRVSLDVDQRWLVNEEIGRRSRLARREGQPPPRRKTSS
jgi:hypothetical protein